MRFIIGSLQYNVDKKLGNGAFGEVYKVQDARGRNFAVKEINYQRGDAKKIVKEVKTMQKCNKHLGTVNLIDFEDTGKKFLILMEYCEGGNLNDRLAEIKHDDHQCDLQWMRELADAIQFLHSQGIVHRDLKPENILLSNNSIKLADFGLARQYTALLQGGDDSNEAYLQYMTNYMETVCGTCSWMAPEVFDHHYTENADVFSLGCIFYVIVTRRFQLSARGEKFFGAFILHQGTHLGIGQAMYQSCGELSLPFGDMIPRSRRDLIVSMLKYDRHERPSAREVHDYLENLSDIIPLTAAENNGPCCC